jgi:DNA-binding IclR family transcriptional regulator
MIKFNNQGTQRLKPPKKATKALAEESYQAPALTKGLEVLEFLSAQTEPYSISPLARALGKSRNEIYRMVIVLQKAGYLARSDSDRFAVTRKLFDVAMHAPPQRNLLAHALPEMERLSEETYQSCHLTVASETDIVVVARVESPATLGFSVRVGYRRPLNQSASGRVLYAFQNERGRAAWRALQPSKNDQQLWAAVEREVKAIRESGHFLSPSSYVDAVTDIAAPVTTLGTDLIAIAALVMPFIGGRSAKTSLTQAAAATREAARRISLHLS